MTSVIEESAQRPAVGTKASLRGSSGMLVGYGASQVINFLVQVGIVRYLSKTEYGAFAWALAAVVLLQAVVPLGLDRASSRFLSLYDERKDYARLFGLIVIELIVIASMGVLVVGGAFLLRGPLLGIAPSQTAVNILLVLIALAPIQALDVIIVDMFAVFSSPWAVFLRRYVMEPLLRLTVVVLLIAFRQNAMFLTVGFTLVGACGLILFVYLLRRLFRRIGLLAHFSRKSIKLPWGQVFAFCGPVMLTSLVAVATTELAAIVLGHFGGATQVAVFRAVQPFAVLNLGVLYTFTTLFTPSASRLLARGALPEVRDLYWQSAIWVAVVTFPILGVTTAFAGPFTVFTLGQRYESSAVVLVILSFGFYVNAAFGFNGFTIQLLGRVRWVLATNIVTLTVMVGVTFLLVHLFAAVGAAVAVLITLIVHNLLKQLGLGFGAGIGVFQRNHLMVLLQVAVAIGVLFAVEHWLDTSIWVGLVIVFVTWLVLLRLTRNSLRLLEVFPEAGRVGALRWLLGTSDPEPEPEPTAAAEEEASKAQPAAPQAPLRDWRLVDWRFLTPAGWRRVGFVGPVTNAEVRVLTESGVEVTREPAPGAELDVVLLTSPDRARLTSDLASLRPGGWLLLRLGAQRSRPWTRIGRGTPSSWVRLLGTVDVGHARAYWHAPNEQRCSYIVDLGDTLAVDAMLRRYEGIRFGRLKSIATRLVNRVGLIHLVARDVTIVGQHRSEDPVQLDAAAPLPMPIDPALSTLLVTPWFEASRHVVALYLDSATSDLVRVAKLPRRAWDVSGIEVEAAALQTVHRRTPALSGHLPEVCQTQGGERPYLLETALVGSPASPESVRARTTAVVESGLDLISRLAANPEVATDDDWYGRLIEQPLTRFAEVVPLDEAAELVNQTLELLAPLRQVALPLVLEHGDLGHPNLIMTSPTRMSAIDWERFEARGLPMHDLIFFLQYVNESKNSAYARDAQLKAFDEAFIGDGGWAVPWLTHYAAGLAIDPVWWPRLVLASWARTSAGLVARLGTPAAPATAPAPIQTDAAGSGFGDLAEAVALDRDYALWRHAVARFDDLLT